MKSTFNLYTPYNKITFYPLFVEKNENQRSRIPLSLRFTFALKFTRFNYSGKVLIFNRIEPSLFFKNINCPMIAIIHNDIQKQLETKNSEVLEVIELFR